MSLYTSLSRYLQNNCHMLQRVRGGGGAGHKGRGKRGETQESSGWRGAKEGVQRGQRVLSGDRKWKRKIKKGGGVEAGL
jgi:hypothetical protein